MQEKYIFEAKNIIKKYAAHTALDDVSIAVPEQSIFGLLGPNGAGKTSLIRIINQITAPDAGTVWLNGEKLERKHISEIGYLPEERGLYKKMKIGEQCIYLARLKGMSRKEAKTELMKWFKKFEIEEWWSKKVEELSKGMAQKIQFITTVMHRPKLLILDEPFSGFDPINTNLVKSEILKLREEGATILLSTHNMNSVEEICDEIALLNNSKKILEGKVKAVKEQYSSNQYTIDFKGNVVSFANAVWGGWELMNREQIGEKSFRATIKLSDSLSLNAYLTQVLPHVELLGVSKVSLSMNDVFIKAVEDQNNATEETITNPLTTESNE